VTSFATPLAVEDKFANLFKQLAHNADSRAISSLRRDSIFDGIEINGRR
jgi:hypothetical protein